MQCRFSSPFCSFAWSSSFGSGVNLFCMKNSRHAGYAFSTLPEWQHGTCILVAQQRKRAPLVKWNKRFEYLTFGCALMQSLRFLQCPWFSSNLFSLSAFFLSCFFYSPITQATSKRILQRKHQEVTQLPTVFSLTLSSSAHRPSKEKENYHHILQVPQK